MQSLFKNILSESIIDSKIFSKNYRTIVESVSSSILKSNIIKLQQNRTLFTELIRKYLILLYFIDLKISDKELFKQYKENSDLLLYSAENLQLITKYRNIINSTDYNNVKDIITENDHNIIQTTILNTKQKPISLSQILDVLYLLEFPNDKSKINKIINDEYFDTAETSTVDIVINNNYNIDYNEIENLLTTTNKETEVYNVLDLIQDVQNQFNQTSIINSESDKFNKLLNSKLIIPITDEIFFKHSNNETYKSHVKDDMYSQESNVKLLYIMNKINEAINSNDDAYSTIIFNEYENINILKPNTQNVEQLRLYKEQAFINYKVPRGYLLYSPSCLTSIRKVSLLNKSYTFRTCEHNKRIDIVGLCLINPLKCTTKKSLLINEVSYSDFTKQIKNKIKNQDYDNVYWIFNENKDRKYIDLYVNNVDLFKLLADKIFDNITAYKNKKIIKILLNSDNIDLKLIKALIEHEFAQFDSEVINNDNILEVLQLEPKMKQLILNKLSIVKSSIKVNDPMINKLYGLDKNKIVLPYIEYKPPKTIHQIDNTIEKELELVRYAQQNATCNHIIEFDELEKKAKIDPLLFDKLLFDFSFKYIDILTNGDYICKSCGQRIMLEQYVAGGQFDEDGRYVIDGDTINIKITDLPEYRNYTYTINILDKLIERMAKIYNFKYIAGDDKMQRTARNHMVKNIIDIIINNNSNIFFDRKNMEKRFKIAEDEYGIPAAQSDFFIFILTDDIFKTIGLETDTQKMKKRNNCLIYMLLYLIIELDKSKIFNMSKNNFCNYNTFKGIEKIFNNINLKLEKSIVPIKNYRVLCYSIFMISCIMSKYNLYYVPDNQVNSKSEYNIKIISKSIYTIIDILNSIVESYIFIKNNIVKSEIKQLYISFYTKYTNKLSNIFEDNEFLNIFESDTLEKIDIDPNISKIENIDGKFEHLIPISINKSNPKNIIYSNDYIKPECNIELKYNKYTNCPDGSFHMFIFNNNALICKKCNTDITKLNDINFNDILDLSSNQQIREFAKLFCVTEKTIGLKHFFKLDEKKNITKCINCNYINGSDINESSIRLLRQYLNKQQIITDFFNDKQYISQQKEKKIKYTIDEYGIQTFIKFIDSIEGTLFNINDTYIKLYLNDYIFDHNHLGFNQIPPIIISQDNITYEVNKIYGSIYYYTLNKINVYYNIKTNYLVGYKEPSCDYVNIDANRVYMAHINYSLLESIKYLFRDRINEENYDVIYNNAKAFISTLVIYLNNLNSPNTMPSIENEQENEEVKTFDFKYHKFKNNKFAHNPYSTESLFINYKEILNDIYLKKTNAELNYLNYIFNELHNFILSIDKNRQQIILEFVIDYIIYYFNIVKINLHNSKNALFTYEIMNYYINETTELLRYDKTIKYVAIKDDVKLLEDDLEILDKELNADEKNKAIEEIEAENEGYDIDYSDDEDLENRDFDINFVEKPTSMWDVGYVM